MKCIIAGDRNIVNKSILEKAIKKSGFTITEVVSGGTRGADTLGEEWAKEHGIPVKEFPADWNNLAVEGVVVKTNAWGKQYNAAAGMLRNKQMADYADALIAIQTNGKTPGTQNMIKLAKENELEVFVYERETSDYTYLF